MLRTLGDWAVMMISVLIARRIHGEVISEPNIGPNTWGVNQTEASGIRLTDGPPSYAWGGGCGAPHPALVIQSLSLQDPFHTLLHPGFARLALLGRREVEEISALAPRCQSMKRFL